MADKKISQLPKINLISGSEVILPIVHDGTTQKMDVSTFAVFASQWSATTGSNTFIGNQTITGNTSIGGNLVVAGKLTAQELFTEITSASIIFESGSTIFGNSGDDTHQFSGSISINGKIVGNAPLDFTSQSLNTQTGSQDLVNRGISSVTGSINTTTSSFDYVFLGISSVTGAINTTTSSFDSVFLGISSFTGSLNSLTGSYATTGSNTFRGNQSITGSLSVSAGEFNVTTGSGNMTSSLIFDHTQNDGVTLGLRHNDRLSLADHTFNVNVWAAGVYTTFVRNGTPYSVLNVEAFDDNKIYLYRDTRLYNKSLVIDNNLTVQKGIVIGSGSLSIERGQLSAVTGSGALTSSLSFTHTEVDPITGDATLALRYRNNDVGPENNAWRFVATDNGVQVRYDQYTTSNKLLFSVSSFGSNFDKLLIWRDARLYGTGLTVDDSLLVKGVITGSLLSTNGVVSSSNQLFELNGQTGSQDLVNLGISSVTGSLIGITNTLMAFTAALDNTYATDVQLYQLYQATASIHSTTQSLNIQTGSQDLVNRGISSVTGSINTTTASFDSVFLRISSTTGSINTTTSSFNSIFSQIGSTTSSLIGITNGLMAFTAALDATYATDAQLYQLYQATASIHSATQSLNIQTGSQDLVNLAISSITGSLIGITNGLMAFTSALDATYATDAQLYQLYQATESIHFTTQSLNTFTGSIRGEVNGLEAYTASLKSVALVSGSAQLIPTFVQNSLTSSMTVLAAATVTVASSNTLNDSTLYPTFTNNIVNSTTSLKSHPSGSFYFDGITRKVYAEAFVGGVIEASGSLIATGSTLLSGSTQIIGNQSITGSLLVTGSLTINSGSITMPNRPAFRVVGTSSTDRVAQTTLSGSYTTVHYNEGNHYNNSTGIFTAPIAGLYNIYFNGRVGSVNAQQQVIVYKNGEAGVAQLMWEAAGNTGAVHFGVNGISKLEVGDTLEAKVAIGSIQFDGNDSFGATYIG